MEPARTSLLELLAGMAGGVAGAVIAGYAALAIGMPLLGRAPGGIHSDWSPVMLLATLVCAVAGGIAGAKGAARLVKARPADSHNRK